MPVSVNTGVVDTEARLSSEREVDMAPKIGMKETDTAQFMTILNKLPSADATQVEIRWLEDQYFPTFTTLAASALSAATSLTVATSTGVYFRVGDIVYIEESSEKVEVTGITSDAIGVTRSIGSVAAATAASGGKVIIVGNASAQGADTGTLKSTDRVLGFNYTQIFRDPFGFTGTDAEIKLYGADDPEREAAKKRIEHKRKLESACWVGGREFTSASPSSKGYMGGIQEFLSTNVFTAFGTLSLSGFDQRIQTIMQDGSLNKVLFMGPTPARALSHLLANNWVQARPDDEVYGAKVSAFVNGAYGTSLPVIVKREWGNYGTSGFGLGGAVFVLDLDYIRKRPMANRNTRLLPNRQGNGEDKVVFDYLTEMSLEVKNEGVHGVLYGVTG